MGRIVRFTEESCSGAALAGHFRVLGVEPVADSSLFFSTLRTEISCGALRLPISFVFPYPDGREEIFERGDFWLIFSSVWRLLFLFLSDSEDAIE